MTASSKPASQKRASVPLSATWVRRRVRVRVGVRVGVGVGVRVGVRVRVRVGG